MKEGDAHPEGPCSANDGEEITVIAMEDVRRHPDVSLSRDGLFAVIMLLGGGHYHACAIPPAQSRSYAYAFSQDGLQGCDQHLSL